MSFEAIDSIDSVRLRWSGDDPDGSASLSLLGDVVDANIRDAVGDSFRLVIARALVLVARASDWLPYTHHVLA